MPDESGRALLLDIGEQRYREELLREFPGIEPPPLPPPRTGLHFLNEHGLRLIALGLEAAADGTVPVLRTIEGEPELVFETVEGVGGSPIDAEVERAELAESDLADAISTETTRATAQESALAAAIAAFAEVTGITVEEAEALFDAKGAVLGKLHSLGPQTGTIPLDLSKGEVFPVTTTGVIKVPAPTNCPKVGKAVYVEIPITGNNNIEVPGITRWIGREPVWDLSSPEAINIIMLVTYDEGATWQGISADALPSNIVLYEGEPKEGDSLLFNPETGLWKPGTPAATIDMAEVLAEIEANAIVVDAPLHVVGEPSEGDTVKVGAGGVGEWAPAPSEADVLALVRERKKWRVVTSSVVAKVGDLILVPPGTGTLTVTMPFGITADDQFIIVRNESSNPVKLKGVWTYGSEEESTELAPVGQTTEYISRQPPEGVSVASWIEWQRLARTVELEALITAMALQANPNTAAAGLLAQSFDQATASTAMVNEIIHLAKVMMPFTKAVKQIVVNIVKAGAGVEHAYAALIDSTGKRLAVTKDEAANWVKQEARAMTLEGGSTTVPGGPGVFCWIALLSVGGTPPELAASGAVGRLRDINVGLTAATARAARGRNSLGTNTYTSIPAELDPTKSKGVGSDDAPLFWAGLHA